jgi:glucan phosphoethanolaminetransferase (alkaline phosphatase superfamily)
VGSLQVILGLRRLQSLATSVVGYTLDLTIISIPTVAIFVHCFRHEVYSRLTQGTIGAAVNLIASALDGAVYLVLLWTALGILMTLRVAFRVRTHWIVPLSCVGLVFLSTTVAEASGEIGADSVGELARSNWREASTYCLQSLQAIDISNKHLAILAIPVSVFLAANILLKAKVYRPNMLVIKISGMVTLVSLAGCVSYDAGNFFQNNTSFSTYRLNLESSTRIDAEDFVRQRSAPTVVVYIGESTERRLFYQELRDKIRDPALTGNLILYSDVVSPASHTFLSLYRVLSVSRNPRWDQLTEDPFLARPNLVSILNANGAETVWYSNQPGNDWIGSLFGREARDAQFFTSNSAAAPTANHSIDSEVLPRVLGGINSSKTAQRVFFFHSYTGHFEYCANIPSHMVSAGSHPLTSLPFHAVYGDTPVLSERLREKNVGCYFSAISNVADNLGSVMRSMMRSSSPTVLIYFSDHGEDPLDGTGHDSGRPGFRKIEVPMAVYFNSEAKRQYKEEFEFARANQDKKYDLEWMSDSILDMEGISNTRRRSLSLFGQLDDLPPRYSSLREYGGKEYAIAVDGIGDSRGVVQPTKIDLYSERELIQSLPPDQQRKVCAHRSDSLLKFSEATEVFSCLEVDLMIEPQQNEIYVYHPPKPNNGLPLSVLLDMLSENSSGIWLDVKNAQERNLEFLLTYLSQRITQRKRHSVLIEVSVDQSESKTLNPIFSKIRNDGFGLSYYLPSDEGISCSEHPEKRGCERFMRTVTSALRGAPFSSLSFDIKAKRIAVPIAKLAGVEMNTWDLGVKSAADVDREMLRDSTKYLIPYESHFDY